MLRSLLTPLIAVSAATFIISCGQQDQPSVAENPAEQAPPAGEVKPEEATSDQPAAPQSMISEMGEFGSEAPLERTDLPERGVLRFTIEDRNKVFMVGEHWEQYNFPFQARRSGRYEVRVSYTLKNSTLGVQLKLGEQRLKKQLKHTGGSRGIAYMGEVTLAAAGDQFMALYTPGGMGWDKFTLHEIALIPTQESETALQTADDGSLHLLAKGAVTWSEHMRYEPKPEKDCLGFWTEKEDFAEWEFKLEKGGKYEVIIHQGCAGGGSEVAVEFAGKQLEFKVEDTGGYQNWKPVSVGHVEIDGAGTYRLAIKPKTKEGQAIMDVQKIVLVPVS